MDSCSTCPEKEIEMKQSVKLKNAKIRMRYNTFLKGAKGRKEKTIEIKERYIAEFERFNKGRDFATYKIETAERYKIYLNEYQWNGKNLHKKTVVEKLSAVRKFFIWLSDQKGYKSRINKSDAEYLQLDMGTMNAIRTEVNIQKIPDIKYVINLVESIEICNEVDMRDAALISFMFFSGLREGSITTIKIKDFDINKLVVVLDALGGAKTKYSKSNTVKLLEFDKSLTKTIINWYNYLLTDKKYEEEMPLFPMTDTKNRPGTYNFGAFEVKPEFWASPSAINKIIEDRSNNAALPYYRPHLIRGLHISLALSYARSGAEMLALSRNIGHDSIKTTFEYYGYMDVRNQIDVLSKIDYEKRMNESTEDQISELKEMMINVVKELKELKEANTKNIDSNKK